MSVDQLKSSVPGLVAQNCPDDDQENSRPKHELTKRRHRHATVFVDHHSCLSYVHIHESVPKPHLVMPFDICEAQSADGKPLRGSVMKDDENKVNLVSRRFGVV